MEREEEGALEREEGFPKWKGSWGVEMPRTRTRGRWGAPTSGMGEAGRGGRVRSMGDKARIEAHGEGSAHAASPQKPTSLSSFISCCSAGTSQRSASPTTSTGASSGPPRPRPRPSPPPPAPSLLGRSCLGVAVEAATSGAAAPSGCLPRARAGVSGELAWKGIFNMSQREACAGIRG